MNDNTKNSLSIIYIYLCILIILSMFSKSIFAQPLTVRIDGVGRLVGTSLTPSSRIVNGWDVVVAAAASGQNQSITVVIEPTSPDVRLGLVKIIPDFPLGNSSFSRVQLILRRSTPNPSFTF